MKKSNGITLIALIVTIIILIILAGITISILIGENGVIDKADKAAKKYFVAKIQEEVNLAQMDKMSEKQEFLTNYEIKEILLKHGTIERTNLKTEKGLFPIEDILDKYSNKKFSDYVVVGYWENYVDNAVSIPMKLSQVPQEYEIINITFARNSDENNGAVVFELNDFLCKTLNYSKKEFQKDIEDLQYKGKKVLISVGGSGGGSFKITNQSEADNFVSSLRNIIDEYKFNGIDLDIETGNIQEEYLENAILQLSDIYGSNIMITLNSSLSGMRSADVNNGKDNMWYKIAENLKDMISITSSRYYNSGTQRGYDYEKVYSREQGHISFITSLAVKQMEDKKIARNNIGITIVGFEQEYEGLPQAYLAPSEIVKALESIIEGKNLNLEYKNFIPPRAYPEFRAVTIWSINKDAYLNNEMVKAVSQYLESKM